MQSALDFKHMAAIRKADIQQHPGTEHFYVCNNSSTPLSPHPAPPAHFGADAS
jgi:hypothetical protein